MVGRGGIQFIDPVNGSVKGDSWYRGACQYGAMPANGLVYVPQHSCACQPEELLFGLNALSPQSSAGEGPPPLEKGPAYGAVESRKSEGQRSGDWPTYRSDVRRSGYQDLAAPSAPRVAWTAKLSSPITAPASADGLVLVAETDHHTLHALSAADGNFVWQFVADGRVDSPPTLSAGRCLFGTRNGFVYCLRASDGAMIWRFRAAPQDRRVVAYEQLESAWPVHGSVLVDGDTIYVAAGRSARMDGGIRIQALDVRTGELVRRADVRMTGGGGVDVIRQSVLPDILSIEKNVVWMRGLGVNKDLTPVPDEPHLFAPRGFLDDTWWHRTYWVYGTKVGGGYSHWPDAGNVVPAGRLLVFDGGKHIYGYGRLHYRMGDGHVRAEAIQDYKLFAEVLAPEPQTTQDRRGEPKQATRRREIQWATNLPFVAKSIVLTRDALLVAGGGSLPDAAEKDAQGIFCIVSRKDGAEHGHCPLPAPPVLDGMALTDSGLFVSMTDGSLACLRSSRNWTDGNRAENTNLPSADETPARPSPQPDIPETLNSSDAELLAQIDTMDLPQGYTPGNAHQDYVDRRMAKLNPEQRARLVSSLAGVHSHALEDLPHGSVLAAHRLLPSDTIYLSRRAATAALLEFGGAGSHAALFAREIGLPCVTDLSNLMKAASPGAVALVDADAAEVIINPSQQDRHSFQAKCERRRQAAAKAREYSHDPAVTKDGVRIRVLANVGCQDDTRQAIENGAEGIGLYRIELACLARQEPPDATELFEEMRKTLTPAKGLPILFVCWMLERIKLCLPWKPLANPIRLWDDAASASFSNSRNCYRRNWTRCCDFRWNLICTYLCRW